MVLERIGMGGMAVVYLVEHQTLLKRFAAKVLSSQHASSLEARARFTQEAHAASQLDHENIVTISDFGITTDDRPYFVMELLRGNTLADRLEEGPMTLEEVVAVSVPVARALAHAHAEGIIHRDVKPENIFLVQRSQGRWGVKVLDFGIAKVSLSTDRMTKTGEALGSPMFMSPEACRGDDVDQRADIYSFGIVLYLMLAGRVPFSDENLLKVLQMQVIAPLPLPSSFNPNMPAALELVLIRALAKEPGERYATMEEFLFAIEAALPAGSDALLIQGQFGTQSTPFPGTLEHIRNSRASSKPPFGVTGDHEIPQADLQSVVRAASLPPAPARKRGRAALVLGTLVVLGAAGAAAYVWQSSPMDATAANKRAAVAAPTPTPTPSLVAAAAVADQAARVELPPVDPPASVKTPAPAERPAPTETPPPIETAPMAAAIATTSVRDTKAAKRKHPAPAPRVTRVAAPSRKSTAKSQPASSMTVAAIVAPETDPETPAVVAAAPPKVEMPAPTVPVAPAPPTPAPTATPTPTPVLKPAPVVVGSMDAKPMIASLDVNGPLPASVVRRGVERVLPGLRACYRAAAAAQKKTPALNVSLTFDIDESSAATNVAGAGTSFGSLSSCTRSAIAQIQTQQAPDVGIAQVGLTIRFTPI